MDAPHGADDAIVAGDVLPSCSAHVTITFIPGINLAGHVTVWIGFNPQTCPNLSRPDRQQANATQQYARSGFGRCSWMRQV